MRPSPGRVPIWPAALGWYTQHIQGPMARSVGDIALMLSATAGPDPRSPIAQHEPGSTFGGSLARDFKGVRVAWSRNLGVYPVEPVVTQVCDAARPAFEQIGCRVEDADPDPTDSDHIFNVLRSAYAALTLEKDYREHKPLVGEHLHAVIEYGLSMDAMTLVKAESQRTRLFERFQRFMGDYEFLIVPTTPAPPFPITDPYLTEINGQKLDNLFTWCGLPYTISLAGLPAISIPAGFTPDGLPIGLQIVGRHQQDLSVLQLASAFEQATGFARQRPAVAA
jgi:amidase